MKKHIPLLLALSTFMISGCTFATPNNANKKKYSIVFKDSIGRKIDVLEVEEGEIPEFNYEPEDTAEWDYTFVGWSHYTDGEVVELEPASVNTIYYAVTTKVKRSYDISFFKETGELYEKKTLEYGAYPTCDYKGPTSTSATTYLFKGWSLNSEGEALTTIPMVTGTANYYAVVKKDVVLYDVTFYKEDGTKIETKKYEYGEQPSCTYTGPESNAQYTCTFKGWSTKKNGSVLSSLPTVTTAASYYAIVDKVTNKYNVSFYDDVGTLYETIKFDYGTKPSYNATKAPVGDIHYSFIGWSETLGGTILTSLPAVTHDVSYYANFEEKQGDAWTIMIYMCGTNLESENGLATSDLQEICSVSNQPDDVNIIVFTGGTNSWTSKSRGGYGISSSYNEIYEVKNKTLNRVKQYSSNMYMGDPNTLATFINYGLTNYPANKTGLIFWNHGGAMQGCCFDEENGDGLLNSETSQAFASTIGNQKLEFVGYDCCLMQVQDIAYKNSKYFNYMVASEEAESGYGWDYDTWIDDVYADKATTVILKAIVDGFISENGGTSSRQNDQTLSYLDLSKMNDYYTAFESLAQAMYNKSPNKSTVKTLFQSVKTYAVDEESSEKSFAIFDIYDFLTKLASNSSLNPGGTYVSDAKTALGNLVAYSSCGRGAGESHGLAMYYSISSYSYPSYYYTSSETDFTNWRTFNSKYGQTY